MSAATRDLVMTTADYLMVSRANPMIAQVTRLAWGRAGGRLGKSLAVPKRKQRPEHATELGDVAASVLRPKMPTSPHWVAWSWLRALVLLIAAACNTFAPWDKPVREHCVCERTDDPHWLVMYVCGNEGSGAAEELALEWCSENFPECIDCACESQGEECSP